MANQQRSSEEENVQRLFLLREVRCKRLTPEAVSPGRKAVGKDIVCASWKHEEVFEKTARVAACPGERRLLADRNQEDFLNRGLTGKDWMAFCRERTENNRCRARDIVARMEKSETRLVRWGDEEYPESLRETFDAPLALYVRGDPMPDCPLAGIVGARRGTPYGFTMAEKFGRYLGEKGIGIVSGLAMGCDARAQKGALRGNGYTVAVLGCGTDICYPKENFPLFIEILQKGGNIISEYPPGTRPAKWRFPERNRIIAGMSACLLVMEAGERSGTRITADRALEAGRDVYALPGRVDMPLSAGCNDLIRQGADILSTPEDLFLRAFGIKYSV